MATDSFRSMLIYSSLMVVRWIITGPGPNHRDNGRCSWIEHSKGSNEKVFWSDERNKSTKNCNTLQDQQTALCEKDVWAMQEPGKKRLHIKASGLNWKSHDYVPESDIYPPENCTMGLESRQMCGCKDSRDLSDWVNDNVANTVEHKHTHRKWRVEWR